jgi:hypothetical protein
MYYFLRKVDDTKGVIRIRKSKDRQYNDQNNQDKQRSTKYYTENFRSRNKNLTKNRGWTHVLLNPVCEVGLVVMSTAIAISTHSC